MSTSSAPPRPAPAAASALLLLLLLWWGAAPAAAQLSPPGRAPADDEADGASSRPRPTVQRRFAEKQGTVYAHLLGTRHIRDDFYNSYGWGVDAGYYFGESLGVELRLVSLSTTLSDAALDLKGRVGLTPDARPQGLWAEAGVRYSIGYGKILVWDVFVVHFDPQITLHGGVATAEARILPTAHAALSLLTHYRWGLQAKLDLAVSLQWEERSRGTIFSMGFAPLLGLGWSFDVI